MTTEAASTVTASLAGARWWALDADGRPCAWPVVTEAPSR